MQTLLRHEDGRGGQAAVDFYFLCEDGSRFKVTKAMEPYFLVATKVRRSGGGDVPRAGGGAVR